MYCNVFFIFSILEKEREGTQVNTQRQDGELHIFSCQKNGELYFEKYKEKDSMRKIF
jgi:hypothetical protein